MFVFKYIRFFEGVIIKNGEETNSYAELPLENKLYYSFACYKM